MDQLNIIVFLCNWGPHAAYQELQDNGYQIPVAIKMVRIPCTGRISKAMLFRAFEMGADGVALVGCASGTCRYGSGTTAARNNTEDTRKIIQLLGLGNQRMRLGLFLPHETDGLKKFLETVVADVARLGKSPIQPRNGHSSQSRPEKALAAIVAEHQVYDCQDCGKCTSSCPLALVGKTYSPRAIVNAVIRGDINNPWVQQDIQSCLTCGICYERCPSAVNFPEFIRDMRQYLKTKNGGPEVQPHGGFFQSLMRAMTSERLAPTSWSHIPDDVQLDPDSKVMFFGGCAPFFDAFFRKHQDVNATSIVHDGLRILNFFDVYPKVLADERCCGHDLLWSGDLDNFQRLAKLNVEMIQDQGVDRVMTACPECYRTLAVDYARYGVTPRFEVVHLYEFLETEIAKGSVGFKPLEKRITYQDSCRLNRLAEIRDFPRKLIRRLAVDEFREMKDSGNSALCCGNCAWTGCDAYSKALQVKRIRQAVDSRTDLMVTSCPKCQIHLRCAMEDPFAESGTTMEMADLTSLIAQTIYWE